jgi:hypothetical protein
MSGRLVSEVFNSTLPAWLKPYAAACASFAADDGTQVYPSVLRVARMVGRCERATQTALHELRRRGVLRVVGPHGRYRTTRYVFQADALPGAHDPDQLPLFPQATSQKSSAAPRFPQFPQALTSSGLHPMGAVGCTRSVIDPSVDHHRARAEHDKGKCPKTGTR